MRNLGCAIIVLYLCDQGQSTYSRQIKQVEDDIQQLLKKINELTGRRLNLLKVCINRVIPAPWAGCASIFNTPFLFIQLWGVVHCEIMDIYWHN